MAKLLPTTSLAQLARLRARERFYLMLWGITQWLAFFVVVLGTALIIDWWIDKYRETPRWVRVSLTGLQVGLYLAAFWFFVLRPLSRGTSLVKLARRAEESIPEFDHRLITAIQLTRSNAKTEGMSEELIEVVSREAEDISARNNLVALADSRRIQWAAFLIWAPMCLLFGLFLFFGPTLFFVLLQRQLLINRDIPRDIHLETVTPTLWPAGDEVIVRYEVRGRIKESREGNIRVSPDKGPSDEYPLVFESRVDDEKTIFAARVPPSTVGFDYRAWLGDGRTKDSSRVDFEPRPVVNRVDAWVQMPDYVGKKPDGTPYETHQQQGEVTGLAGSTARVRIDVQKPVVKANLILIARGKDGVSEKPLPAQDMMLSEDHMAAEAQFILAANLLAYRIEVIDRFGFSNATPPRRGIALSADDPPHVALLPERFAAAGESATEDTEVEGMPIPLGGAIRVAYTARSPLGLAKARLAYRVNEGSWSFLPLKEARPDEKTGPFNLLTGAFQNSPPNEAVEFFALPSPDPMTLPNRIEGGGRFDFQTRALKKQASEDGTMSELEVGDRVEFYVEVFDRNPAAGRQPGRSDARIKGIVTDAQFVDWVVQTLQSESRLRQLEEKQKGVFTRPLPK